MCQDDGLESQHRMPIPAEVVTKKDMAKDICLIFTDHISVSFIQKDKTSVKAMGRWCKLCR